MNQKLPKVLVLDDYEQAFSQIGSWGWVQAHCDWQVHHQPLRGETLRHALQDVEVLVLMRDRTPLTADLVAPLDALKLVVFTGTRNQALDMAALKTKGVKVCHHRLGAFQGQHDRTDLGPDPGRVQAPARQHRRLAGGAVAL